MSQYEIGGLAFALLKATNGGRAGVDAAVRHLPFEALKLQEAHEEAPVSPARFVFTAASMCLGFAGDPLPVTFAGHRDAYRAGVDIRRRFDSECRKEST